MQLIYFAFVEVSFDVTLTLDQPFDPDLDDPNSPAYINLKTDIENMVCLMKWTKMEIVQVENDI